MNSYIVSDFDGTITKNDITFIIALELLKLRPWKILKIIKSVICFFFAKEIMNKQNYKNHVLSLLLEGLNRTYVLKKLSFLKSCNRIIFRKTLIDLFDEKIKEGYKILIVSASPNFIIKMLMKELDVEVIGTKFSTTNNVFDGKPSIPCFSENKVKLIKKWESQTKGRVKFVEAWSDSVYDTSMMNLAENKHWIYNKSLKKFRKQLKKNKNYLHYI